MTDLGPGDTVLCTTMGFGPLRAFVEAASSAGFSAISLSGGDYKAARSAGMSDPDIRTLLADNAIRVAELDGVVDWLRPLPREQGQDTVWTIPSSVIHKAKIFDMAGHWARVRLRRSTRSWALFHGMKWPEAFARLCDRAADFCLLVHLEFLSWGPVPDPVTASDVVRLANRPNGGLVLDTLHLMRSGGLNLSQIAPEDFRHPVLRWASHPQQRSLHGRGQSPVAGRRRFRSCGYSAANPARRLLGSSRHRSHER